MSKTLPKGTFARYKQQKHMKNTLLTTPWGIADTFFDSGLFNSIFDVDFSKAFNALNVDPYPTDQYLDKDGNLVLEVPLAGYKKEDISVSIEKDYLVLSVKHSEKSTDIKYIVEKIRKKALTLKWYLNDTFVQSEISSNFSDGLLKIVLPVKKNEKKEDKITINVS
jgi:HSP20 family molecular chaperone IbpA